MRRRRPNHDLRHTFATILFDAGASAPDVQATLGHSSLQVTERYSRAREGGALRAGAVSTRPSAAAPGRLPGQGARASLAAAMAQEWPVLSRTGREVKRQAGKSLIRRDFRWWLRWRVAVSGTASPATWYFGSG
ncbi:tyrosine-type recombinase/integrase [Microbacterium sp.]|uniref:tyrosine-type recombinase/integrase n=1 Tax=Microbacterium sp. TaxID=51671 RepID=UPI003A83D8AF